MDAVMAWVGLAIGFGLFAWGYGHARRRARHRTWRQAAERAGLSEIHGSGAPTSRGFVLTGRSGELRVRLEEDRTDDDEGTRIVVDGPLPPGGGLSVLREDRLTTTQRRHWAERDILTGDPDFDSELFLQGPRALVFALLDSDTRRLVRALMRDRVTGASGRFVSARASLRGGEIEVRLPDEMFGDSLERRLDVLPCVLDVARRLVAPADLAARIAENVGREPEAGVRCHCLATLATKYPDHPATRRALLAGRNDPNPEVRVQAGIALGPKGRDTLRAVALSAAVPDGTSARAVGALAEELSPEESTALLRSSLRARRLATARVCLQLLGRAGTAAVPAISEVLHDEERTLVADAAAILGAAGDASAEPALLSALGSPHAAVRLAVAKALGRVGTVAAVMPLMQAEETREPDAELRRAVRQAIAEIRSRVPGAGPGQLSLAVGEAGQLSVAEGEEGRLSISDGSQTAGPSRPGPTGSLRMTDRNPADAGRTRSLR